MGCRIMTDEDEGLSCFYDSVTMSAFGPVFQGIEDHPALEDSAIEAEAFMCWCMGRAERFIDEHTPFKDPRAFGVAEIERLHAEWTARQRDAAGLPE